MSSKLHDVLILGAAAAGCSAAVRLARADRDVLVLDSPSEDQRECPLLDWAPSWFFDKVGLPASTAKEIHAEPFSCVRYYDASLKRKAEHGTKGAAGYFVDPHSLAAFLRRAAAEAGARLQKAGGPTAIRLNEDHVEVVGPRAARGRVLIVTDSPPAGLMAQLGRSSHAAPLHPMTATALDVPLSGTVRRAAERLAGALHVVELPERSEMGLFFQADARLHLRVISTSATAGNRGRELSGMINRLQHADILPRDLRLGEARGAVWYPPAGLALEQETHEAKCCLLAGAAGGFAETVTGHTLTPTILSALLAADVTLEALDSGDPQEKLMTYNRTWRDALADYLRPPGTSPAMLLPLLFVNPRIVPRFTRALLYGEDV